METESLSKTAQAVSDVKSWLRSYKIDASNLEDIIRAHIDAHRIANPDQKVGSISSETDQF
jgi:hypothetical protein